MNWRILVLSDVALGPLPIVPEIFDSTDELKHRLHNLPTGKEIVIVIYQRLLAAGLETLEQTGKHAVPVIPCLVYGTRLFRLPALDSRRSWSVGCLIRAFLSGVPGLAQRKDRGHRFVLSKDTSTTINLAVATVLFQLS
ncbi:hypothetical protein [Burkholderia ubonensis]|uniref:hypothetical protein n=1 Tax=Burkholderia ubonensis TaxID=101571 RepID=UPI0007557DEF|nr:hypothetical protein [Burkholderia ubonensis]KVA22179.1 hypothetical protein WI42_08470 [Burkholderia ubonensis]KVA23822.1 hypothetical protein WI43_11290 [Burkholderia ubonensis]KVA39487.1 hypothetical protein WI46_15360 [Burkholderia ubonensis]